MNRSFSRVPTLLCLLALPIAACAGERAEDVATDGAELRKLLPSEIVGSISYGETKTVTYAAEPRYRAFSFHAKQGDKIDARFVGAKGLDTVGFLLSDTFATVKQNDDESTASRASRFTHEISTTGTYYLAVREANEEDGQITISLTKVDGATPPPPPVEPPPPTPGQAFNPRSCTGNVLTQARAIKYFPKGSASGRVTISAKPGRAYLRARVCSEFSGCADWVEKDVTKPSADGALRANYGNMFDTSPAGVALSLVDRADDPVDLFMAVSAGSRTWATGYVNSTHRLELRGYERPGAVRVTPY
ncbi:MAG TPA: hypothetical protein VM925_11515, partial [Labilithrix sp.]|nr:hypothetical protein [Labilithrix sp.]